LIDQQAHYFSNCLKLDFKRTVGIILTVTINVYLYCKKNKRKEKVLTFVHGHDFSQAEDWAPTYKMQGSAMYLLGVEKVVLVPLIDSEEHTGNSAEKRKRKPNFTTQELTIITENMEASCKASLQTMGLTKPKLKHGKPSQRCLMLLL